MFNFLVMYIYIIRFIFEFYNMVFNFLYFIIIVFLFLLFVYFFCFFLYVNFMYVCVDDIKLNFLLCSCVSYNKLFFYMILFVMFGCD